MKKTVLVTLTIIGLVSFSSCRSTSKPCGLAEYPTHQLNASPQTLPLLHVAYTV